MKCRLELISVGSVTALEALIVQRGRFRLIHQPFVVGLLTHPTRGQWLIDTGLHERMWRGALWVRLFLTMACASIPKNLEQQLQARGFQPQGILLTHLHIDHVAGLQDFPAVPIIVSREAFLGPSGPRAGVDRKLLSPDFEGRATWLEDIPGGDVFGDVLVKAHPLPGHAAGQHGFEIETEAGPVLLTADACGLSEMIETDALPRLPRFIANDWAAEQRTLRKLRELHRERPELKMIPSHCPRAWRDISPR